MVTIHELAFRAARHAALAKGVPPYPGVPGFDRSLKSARYILEHSHRPVVRLWWAFLDWYYFDRGCDNQYPWLLEAARVLEPRVTIEGRMIRDSLYRVWYDGVVCVPPVPKPVTRLGDWAAYVHWQLPPYVYVAELRYRAARVAARRSGIQPFPGIEEFDRLMNELDPREILGLATSDYLVYPTFHPGEVGWRIDYAEWERHMRQFAEE